jgi:shikimate kinase
VLEAMYGVGYPLSRLKRSSLVSSSLVNKVLTKLLRRDVRSRIPPLSRLKRSSLVSSSLVNKLLTKLLRRDVRSRIPPLQTKA